MCKDSAFLRYILILWHNDLEGVRVDADVYCFAGDEPVAVCVGRTCCRTPDADVLSFIAVNLGIVVQVSCHQKTCEFRHLQCAEHVDYCNVKPSVADVGMGSDLGPVTPLVGVSYSDESSIIRSLFPVYLDRVFVGSVFPPCLQSLLDVA